MIPFDEATAAPLDVALHPRAILGDWMKLQLDLPRRWPRLTPQDVATISGGRDELMRVLQKWYGRSYGQIDHDVTEFELREVRSANSARVSHGIQNDG